GSDFVPHLRGELVEVEVVTPSGDSTISDFEGAHHRQGDGPFGPDEMIDSLSHHDGALCHDVDEVNAHPAAHAHEYGKGGLDGFAPLDRLHRSVVVDGVLAEE